MEFVALRIYRWYLKLAPRLITVFISFLLFV
jgi:hypothetical protein